ncbi:MAG: hypothetical protein K6U80_00980 [Firmicutes bacterium]|nr:hypothetical protein [Bacillota bacterium]
MHFQDLVIILGFNVVVILFFFMVQKKALAKHIKHLKKEIQELEDLVAAIIEEFEEIANPNPENRIENGIEVNEGLRAGDSRQNIEANLEADWVENIEADQNDGSLGKTPFTPGENLNLEARAVGASEEEIKFVETEYLPGNEFGLFKAVPNQTRKMEGQEPAINPEFINDPRRRQILDLWKQGLSIEEIARQLSMGRGEIQLILGIYRRG